MVNKSVMAIRTYAPCPSCETHNPHGTPRLRIEIVNKSGELIERQTHTL